jgi:ubiquinone/menaquinone biosynthesis C-methylase UbiE
VAARDPVQRLFRAWSKVYDQPVFQQLFYRRVHAALMKTLAGVDPRVVVDLGCGTAQLTTDLVARFGAATVVGADFSAEMLAAARRRLGDATPPLICANVYALPFGDGAIDLVVSTISYHWYLEPARALAEIHRVLAPGGRFVLATLVSIGIGGVVARQRWVPPSQHLADLRAAGFEVSEETRVRPAVRVFSAIRR